jgi:hypothetical protein
MSALSWNDIFALPQAALVGERRIPKTVLVRQALLTKTEQKTLDKVAHLAHFATVQKSTTRIMPLVDGEHDIQSVVFLRCDMADSAAYAEVARLIHKCFPNPTVILFGEPGKGCVSVALTRKSLAEQGATVVERIESTGAVDLTAPALAPFAASLSFACLPQENLLAYLEGLAWSICLSRTVPSLGFFPRCDMGDRERLEALVAEHERVSVRVEEVRRLRCSRDITLNVSAKLRVEQKGLEREIGRVTAAIKEMCDGGD